MIREFVLNSKLSFSNFIFLAAELAKIRITLFVAFTTSIGYILFSGEIDYKLFFVSLGVFFLAAGASALNHLQEWKYDSLMERTKNRPLPSGKLSQETVVLVFIIYSLLGIFFLLSYSNLQGLLLGVLNLVWYNLLYTPLKRNNPFAILPGSVVGAIPPIIGWVSAGGDIFNPEILSLSLFFFIWQIPHFWLLLILFAEDYEKAGYPTLKRVLTDKQIARITFYWILALVVITFFVPAISNDLYIFSFTMITLLGFLTIVSSYKIITNYNNREYLKKTFININLYVLSIIFVFSIDELFL